MITTPRAEVEAELALWEPWVIPASPKETGLVVDRTVAFFADKKLPKNWADIAWGYIEVFEDVPLDLVEAACKHVRFNCTFFPAPAEFRAPIVAELNERKSAVWGLQHMLRSGDFLTPTPRIG